jgi:hypothetical protein
MPRPRPGPDRRLHPTRLGLSGSSQFRIFLFGFCQDRNLEFRILPRFKEGLVGSSCLHQVALHRIGAAKLQAGKCTHRVNRDNTAVVKDLSELRCCLSPAMRDQISLPTQINGIECAEVAVDENLDWQPGVSSVEPSTTRVSTPHYLSATGNNDQARAEVSKDSRKKRYLIINKLDRKRDRTFEPGPRQLAVRIAPKR